ncbi:MAG: O-acetylhomoserine aminocarboxypropyltransferase/cysteine synthase [Clostridia bacterium]|nr:O-acetylhomoserine aminocarboxypropyltransferase/cysteine synthase [Clostridia bacterium]
MRDETKCLHEGYTPENGGPGVMPIVQSTTYRFDSTEHIGDLFNMPNAHMYSRFSNPTVECVEKKIASLEGGVAAMCTSAGQAASLMSVLNLCKAGDSFVSTSTIYGGTVNLFAVTLKRFGIECIFVDADAPAEEISAAFKENTRCMFAETIANPALAVADIEKLAGVAHAHGVPLIVDNTFATPYLCKPFEFGADIVVHSTTKYMDGHALQVGGVIVDSGKFDWTNGKFPEFTEPDDSYHGVVYTRDLGAAAYIAKARMQLMRDIGAYPSAMSGFLLNLGLETLPLRMERYCQNAYKVAKFLSNCDKVSAVRYPGLEGDKYYELGKKYLKGASGVISFDIKGGKDAAVRFMDGLKLACNEVHVADIRTCVLHPASATHRQLTDEQLVAAGINPGMIRLSVGLEHIDDILEDIKSSMDKV